MGFTRFLYMLCVLMPLASTGYSRDGYCRYDDECLRGETCLNNRCQRASQCFNDSDCAAGQVCLGGRCNAGCQPETRCDSCLDDGSGTTGERTCRIIDCRGNVTATFNEACELSSDCPAITRCDECSAQGFRTC